MIRGPRRGYSNLLAFGPDAAPSGGVELWIGLVCHLSQSQMACTLVKFCPLASECTENRGLLVAQSLLQLTAKLAQQANFLIFCSVLSNFLFCQSMLLGLINSMNGIQGKSAGIFTQTTLTLGALLTYVFCLLHSSGIGTLVIAGFLGQESTPLNLALQTISATTMGLTHAYDSILTQLTYRQPNYTVVVHGLFC